MKKYKIINSDDSVKSDVASKIVLSSSPEYDPEIPSVHADSDNAQDKDAKIDDDCQSDEQSQGNDPVEGNVDSDNTPGESAKEVNQESDDGTSKPKPKLKQRKLRIKLFGVRKRKKKSVQVKCDTCKLAFNSVLELN